MSSNAPRPTFLVKALFAVTALFALWASSAFISSLGLEYYPTVYRATVRRSLSIVLVSPSLDPYVTSLLALLEVAVASIVWHQARLRRRFLLVDILICIPLVSLLFSIVVVAETCSVLLALFWLYLLTRYSTQVIGQSGSRFLGKAFACFLFVLVLIGGASLFRWVLNPVVPSVLYEDASWHFSTTELQLFYAGSILCPPFLVLIAAVVVAYPAAAIYVSSLVSLLGEAGRRLRGSFLRLAKPCTISAARPRLPFGARVVVLAAVALSLLTVSYPYAPAINPKGAFVGVDFHWYDIDLKQMLSTDLTGAISYALGRSVDGAQIHYGERPLSQILHYLFAVVFQSSSSDTVKYVPLLFNPLLVIAVFIFARELTGNTALASLAALLSSTSFTATVGMYGGFLANWFALGFVYLGLTALLRSFKRGSNRMLALAVLAFVFVLFTHPYAWGLVMASLALCLVWGLFKHWKGTRQPRGRMTAIVAVLALNLLADLIKSQILLSASGVAVEGGLAAGNLSLVNFLEFWPNLIFTFRHYVGGYFTHPLALFLALLGTYLLVRREDPGSRIVIAWLSVVALPLFFGTYMIQSRILYDLPLDVLSAIGLYKILGILQGPGGRTRRILSYLFLVFALLIYFNYGFRCMRNLLPAL